jgi:hypothetical protein
MRYHNLVEARRNPDLNTHARNSASIEELLTYAKKPGWWFASFTKLDKIGVNPRSTFDTPIGIYAYPIGLMEEQIEGDTVPFAGQAPYISVIKLVNEIGAVFLRGDSVARFQKLNEAVGDFLLDRFPLLDGDNKPLPRERVKELIWSKVFTYAAENAYQKSPAGIWWAFSRLVAHIIVHLRREGDAKGFGPADVLNICHMANHESGAAAVWTNLLLRIGVTAVVDEGMGIIHSNEPIQAVFFSTRVIRVVDRLNNPRTDVLDIEINQPRDLIKAAKQYGRYIKPGRMSWLIERLAGDRASMYVQIEISNNGGEHKLVRLVVPDNQRLPRYAGVIEAMLPKMKWDEVGKRQVAHDIRRLIMNSMSDDRLLADIYDTPVRLDYSAEIAMLVRLMIAAAGVPVARELCNNLFAEMGSNGEPMFSEAGTANAQRFAQMYGLGQRFAQMYGLGQ